MKEKWDYIKTSKMKHRLFGFSVLCVLIALSGFFLPKMAVFLSQMPIDYRNIMLGTETLPQKEESWVGQIWDGLCNIKKSQETLAAVDSTEAVQERYWDNQQAVANWNFDFSKFRDRTLSDSVQVIIYHTHNAESYLPSDGVSKREGENAGVVAAANCLAESLESKYGIRTHHCLTIHDYPDWSRSYVNSLATMQGLLNAYPDAKMVFDVHRDAGYTDKTVCTATVNGKSAAKILLVVGGNHENYQKNLEFAQKLQEESDRLYPNLIKGIHIAQSCRYNQHLHPCDIIVEVGSDLNTQEEANYSMECFAQVCAELLEE